jgi:hypothetical protein
MRAATKGWMQAGAVRRSFAAAVALVVAGLVTACSQAPLTQPSWPAPSDAMAQARKAGFTPTDREYLATHTHVHLDVLVDGTAVPVPAGIGIDTKAKGVTETPTPDGTGKDYQVTQCDVLCLSELHTHAPDGIVHSESRVLDNPPATLGQFFTEWGVRMDGSCIGEFCSSNTSIAVYVNGKKTDGNPADIKLDSHLEIAIVIGKAPDFIPDSWDFLPGQ